MKKGNMRSEMPKPRAGGQWTSAQCVQKVEEMLSRAISQQEDLWGMLIIHSPENAPFDDSIGEMKGEESISPHLLKALKMKLENSMDWCHLALCRLKEIISHSSSFLSPADSSEITGLSPTPSSSTRLNVPSPLSALRVPVSKEPLSSYPFTNTGRLHNEWSPGSFFLNEASQMPCRAQTCDAEQLQESMSLIVPDGEHQQGQRYSRLPSLGWDSDWNMLAEAQVSDLPTSFSTRDSPGAAPIEAHQSSSSCQLNLPDASDNGAAYEDQGLVSKPNNRGLRPRCGPKRDREETNEKDTTVSVVFQELKPGDDTKKGIPDDGHRGWKKYGNKTIQNSNFCRGYYKCSMRDCRAKKMVQPTDKNPTIFEVTYVGSHTCSSTSRRRHRSRATPKATAPPNQDTKRPPPSPGAGDILVQTKIARLLKTQATCSTCITSITSITSITEPDPTLTQPKSNDLGAEISFCGELELEDKTPSWHENHELSDVINDSKEMEDCSADQEFEGEDVYLDQISSRDEELGFPSFQSDSLLWQEILSSHREGWNGLQVEI